jgi:hypothetical protein
MKRLFILIFAVCLVSSASAALFISVNGVIEPPFAEVTLEPSNTAVIGIHGDGLTPSPLTAYLLVEGPGWIDGHKMVYRGLLSDYQEFPFTEPCPGPCPTIDYYRELFGMPELMDLSLITFADAAITPAPLDGLLLDDIILHCQSLGDVMLSLVGDDFAALYDTQAIRQIPEPVTLLLLGMGGLILARKAKAVRIGFPRSGVP